YQDTPPDASLGVSPKRQATMLGLAAMPAWRLPRVTMLIQYLYRDEPQLSRFQRSPLRGRSSEARAGGIQAAVRAKGARRDARNRLGADSRRAARPEAVPARGAAQEPVAGGRPRPADERRRLLHAHDSTQARRTASDLVAA